MSDSEDCELVICFMCGKTEEKQSRVIECVQCNRSVHLKCKRIMGNSVVKARKKPFFCSAECIDMHQRIEIGQVGMTEFIQKLTEVSTHMQEAKLESTYVRAELEKTRSQMTSLIKTSKDVEESQRFISSEFEKMKQTLTAFRDEIWTLKQENADLKDEVANWQDKYDHLAEKVDHLELELDKVNRTSLAKNAVIMGLPSTANENVNLLVLDVCAALQCEIGETDITSARRLSGKNSSNEAAPVLITFGSVELKNRLLQRKQSFGILHASAVNAGFAGSKKRITIRDEMTSFGRDLLQKVKAVQASLNIQYVWPGRDGKILIRRHEGAKVEQIGNKSDLLSLGKTIYKRTLNASATSSMDQESPSSQPPPKK